MKSKNYKDLLNNRIVEYTIFFKLTAAIMFVCTLEVSVFFF